jgi:hypothetical protein
MIIIVFKKKNSSLETGIKHSQLVLVINIFF